MYIILKYTASVVCGGGVYLAGEMAFRHFTGRQALHAYSVLTYLMGAVAVLGLELICVLLPMHGLLFKSLAGGVWITAVEAAFGSLLLEVFGVRTWDYSDVRFNFRGIICPKWSALWILLSALFVVLWQKWLVFAFKG